MSLDALQAQVSDLAAQVSRLKMRQNSDPNQNITNITKIVKGPYTYLKDPVQVITGASAGDWQTLDLSDHIPAEGSHALLQIAAEGVNDTGELLFRSSDEAIELNGIRAAITGSGEDLDIKLPPSPFPLNGSSRSLQYKVVEAFTSLTVELVGYF